MKTKAISRTELITLISTAEEKARDRYNAMKTGDSPISQAMAREQYGMMEAYSAVLHALRTNSRSLLTI